jgi:hypothetical protein
VRFVRLRNCHRKDILRSASRHISAPFVYAYQYCARLKMKPILDSGANFPAG